MAPEQFQGRAVPASDVYSIGATALWMLTQTQPEDLPHKGLGIDVAAALGSRASPALVTVLSAMLQPDPEKRAQSIAPLLTGFETRPRETSGQPPVAAPTPAPPPSRPAVVIPEDAGEKLEEVGEKLAIVFRRFLPIFWVFAGLAWWWLPFRTALGFTIGLVVLMTVARGYGSRKGKRREPKMKFKRYARTPAIRVANVDDDLKIRVSNPPKQESTRTGDEEEAPTRSLGQERRR